VFYPRRQGGGRTDRDVRAGRGSRIRRRDEDRRQAEASQDEPDGAAKQRRGERREAC